MNQGKVVAIIQARMSSSRLPGKVLRDISGQSMLERMMTRVARSREIDLVLVATTTDGSDDPIVALCAQKGWPVFRGSLHDVLDRYYQAAVQFQATTIVRLTADCPMIDPEIIDQTIRLHVQTGADFTANRLPPPFHRTFPIGMDTEVFRFSALGQAWRTASEKYEREHVTPHFYVVDGRFKVSLLNTDPDYGHLRWTVDTQEDLELIRKVYAHFEGRDDFTYAEILALFQTHPELLELNANIQHKTFKDVDARS